jgi:hypothetical protein
MSKYLLSAAAAAALLWSSPAFADHCGGGVNVHVALDPVVSIIDVSSDDVVNQGYSNQPQQSPDGQGTSGYTETTTTTSTQNRAGCQNPGGIHSIVNVGAPIIGTTTEISDEFGPQDSAPGQL